MKTDYDAIVVGAGPAGSTAARRLALAGRSVLLLDRARFPRFKACGGGLTGNVTRHVDFDLSPVIENHVTTSLFIYRADHRIELRPEGLKVAMVRRDRFDELLVRQAQAAGAELREEAGFRGMERVDGRRRVTTTAGEFTAPVVIGCDGAASPTARAAGLRQGARLGIALDADIEVPPEQAEGWRHTSIFDFGTIPRGYGWSFPKAEVFSVGVGTVDARFPDARRHLDDFIRRQPCLRNPRPFRLRSAPLPFWTRHEPLARDGVFLAGDAAGLVDPLSGEGIGYAIRSGVLAARYALSRIEGDRRAEDGYSDAIGQGMARNFRYALRLANVFFRHPALSYFVGVRSPHVNDLFARLIAGKIDYVTLHQELSSSLPGRLYRLMKPLLEVWR